MQHVELEKAIEKAVERFDEMTRRKMLVEYHTIYAELCLHNFTERFPDDKRPHHAITCAREWLQNPTETNEKAAIDAAADANRAADEVASINERPNNTDLIMPSIADCAARAANR